MNYYLSKYVGTYRVRSEIDQRTNDYCRDKHGNLCNNNDIYIECYNGIRIYHYGRDVLLAYIPSLIRGRNLIKNEDIKQYVFDIEESDSEVLFKFKDINLSKIISYMKPYTSGVNTSPVSPKLLPKKKYQYTASQIEAYKKITASIDKKDALVISKINKEFLSNVLPKKLRLKPDAIKDDMKRLQLKGRDYIYEKGQEEEYLKYLKKRLEEIYSGN